MKQKFKKFFTLDHRKSDGFTLVELIVVIAILAILGGATVPAYNLYIKKARESADEQILAAVNSAFASACIENKVDVKNVSDAKISVIDNSVQGVSAVELADESVFADNTAKESFVSGVLMSFDRLYTQTNENKTFVTELVNSLDWEENGFIISKEFVDAKIVLANGKIVQVSAEDMKKIQESAFADMGYTGVADAINNLTDSSESLAGIAERLGMMDKLTNVMVANGLINATDAANLSASKAANGLQMVTAKYLAGASDKEINDLLNVNLYGSTYGMLVPLATGTGGTKTVSAAALQYAVVEAYAKTDAGKGAFSYKSWGKTYTYDSVDAFLNSDAAKDDPIWALSTVKSSSGYKTYTTTEQYKEDVNGFVGTMSLLGDNIGTTSNPGAVDINGYFQNGVNSSDAENILTEVLGP